MRPYEQRFQPTMPAFALAVALSLVAAAGAAAGDAYLGITMSSLSPSMSRALKLDEGVGVLVDKVVVGSPAEQAGLQSGDVITAIGDQTITGNRDLTRILRENSPGDELRLTIQREGKQRRLKVTVGERPERKVDGRDFVFGDAEFWRQLTGDPKDRQILLKDLGLQKLTSGFLGVVLEDAAPAGGPKGAIVRDVVANSPAQRAGIQAADLIVAIDDKDVESPAALQERLDDTIPGQEIEVGLVRDGKRQEMKIELAGMAERFGYADVIKRLQSEKPGGFSIRPVPPVPPVPRPHRDLDAERENLEELRQELDQLREQLRQLREELGRRK